MTADISVVTADVPAVNVDEASVPLDAPPAWRSLDRPRSIPSSKETGTWGRSWRSVSGRRWAASPR